MTSLRLPYQTLSPEAYRGLGITKKALTQSRLGQELVELVNLRVSQLNGCAYCLTLHAAALRARGVPEAKLDSLAGWRVSARFDARERAALAWTEALVDIAHSHAPDALFEALRQHFDEVEIADLCFAIALMSAFNRLAIGLRQ